MVALGNNSDQDGTGSIMASPRTPVRPQVAAQTPGFMWPFMAPCDMGIKTDLGCGETTDPNVVLDSSPDLAKATQIWPQWHHGL